LACSYHNLQKSDAVLHPASLELLLRRARKHAPRVCSIISDALDEDVTTATSLPTHEDDEAEKRIAVEEVALCVQMPEFLDPNVLNQIPANTPGNENPDDDFV